MTIIDSHCHLDLPAFDADRDVVLQRARDAGVAAIILIGTHPASWDSTARLAATWPGFARAVGVHPNEVRDQWTPSAQARLSDELRLPDVVAVGETGLDYYRSPESRAVQLEAFGQQLGLAASLKLPVVIHHRQAEQDILEALAPFAPVTGVMHCFGGDWEFARQCLEMGLHLGIGGVATFRRSDDVRGAIRRAPADRIVLETDAPYLAPQRWRGKRNEPAYLTEVVETIAAVRGETYDQVVQYTARNTLMLFGAALVAPTVGESSRSSLR